MTAAEEALMVQRRHLAGLRKTLAEIEGPLPAMTDDWQKGQIVKVRVVTVPWLKSRIAEAEAVLRKIETAVAEEEYKSTLYKD